MNETSYDGRHAERRERRKTILPLTALDQLRAGVPIFYRIDGLTVEELPDGSRYIVEVRDGGRSVKRLREI